MAEKAILFTTGATGDGATAYTQAEVIRWQRQTFIGADNEGVAKGYLNELETTGASSPVATNTGAAYVHGFPYWNTTSKDTAIPTPSGNTRIDRLVLRAGWSAQTVRITRIAGTEGSGTPPALVQTDGTTWDNPLYQASITTGGVITLTDEREFLHPNIAVNAAMLDDDAVTRLYRRQGGHATEWNVTGVTDYTPGAVRMQTGSKEWTGAANTSGALAVTFPVAFSDKPLGFANCIGIAADDEVNVVVFINSNTTMTLYWRTIDVSQRTSLDFSWFAVGPE